ncbi:MAG: AzlD domain-containing protein [Candidatus Limnocylindrales bacterium]
MTTGLIGLAVLMALVTYPSRSVPLLAPGFDRLPPRALEYLRLVGPAVLASIAASQIFLVAGAGGSGSSLSINIEWPAVAACIAIVAWRRNLLLGLVAAVVIVAGARALGLAS